MAMHSTSIESRLPAHHSAEGLRQVMACLAFLAVGLCGYAALEGLNYVAVRAGDGFVESMHAYEKAGPIQGLIVGDSHPAYDIDPESLGAEWHNFAYPGENLIMTYFKLKYVLEQGRRPAYLVLPLDYHSLSSYRINGADYSNYLELARHGELRDAIGLKAWVKSMVKKYLPLTSSFNRQQFVEYMVKRVKSLWAGSPEVARTYAVRPHGQLISLREGFSMKGADERRRLAAGRYREQMKAPLVSPVLVEYFQRILALCEDHGILLIGVRFPLSGAYAQLLQGNPDIDRVAHIYERERSRFAIMKNYEYIYVGKDECFSDADHLNAQGSMAFSKVLAEDLNPMLTSVPQS